MNQTATAVKANGAVETVTMSDGRKVDFVGKRKLLKESIGGDAGGPAVRLDFRNGTSITFGIPEALIEKFALHGAEQKLGDETAGTEDVDDMQLDVEALIDRLNAGEWSTKREGGGMGGTSVLLRAIVEAKGRSIEEVKAFLSNKTQAEKMALRNSKLLKPIVERLEAEKLSKGAKVDTDALLAGI